MISNIQIHYSLGILFAFAKMRRREYSFEELAECSETPPRSSNTEHYDVGIVSVLQMFKRMAFAID